MRGVVRLWSRPTVFPPRGTRSIRFIHMDGRNRVSQFWTPPAPKDVAAHDPHALLARAGYLHQSHSGIFHLLPLGLRVQDKLERLIDKHMRSIGASKLALSTITTKKLWQKTGRYAANPELFGVKDRKDSGFLLSPTHEEEITALVKSNVMTYKQLPLRLYQITRKYRDEMRPRQGLLRAKEFLMKDLYTFDHSHENALETYKEVRAAYNALFNELKVPYLVADADSGAMGGNLSHEYHFVSPQGEDIVWSCNSCDYTANEELAMKGETDSDARSVKDNVSFIGISLDRETKICLHIPRPPSLDSTSQKLPWHEIHNYINLHAAKTAYPGLDTGIAPPTLSDLLRTGETKDTVHIYDTRITPSTEPNSIATRANITKLQPDDPCPRCTTGSLTPKRAIEVAHTFHLGTRYSSPIGATVTVANTPARQPIEMGCHGIGVSRLLGALAVQLSTHRGLNWPRVVAPFECLIFSTLNEQGNEGMEKVYDVLGQGGVDCLIDDRPGLSVGYRFRDAQLRGYPVVVVVGNRWVEQELVEVECERVGLKETVSFEDVRGKVVEILDRL